MLLTLAKVVFVNGFEAMEVEHGGIRRNELVSGGRIYALVVAQTTFSSGLA